MKYPEEIVKVIQVLESKLQKVNVIEDTLLEHMEKFEKEEEASPLT